jgi:hypothetical protein
MSNAVAPASRGTTKKIAKVTMLTTTSMNNAPMRRRTM